MVKTKISNNLEDKTTQTTSFWVDYQAPNTINERLCSLPMPYPQRNIQSNGNNDVKENFWFNFPNQYYMHPFVSEQMCCNSYPWFNIVNPEESGETRKCPYCKQAFKNAKGLNQHVGKMHLRDDRNVVCTICNNAFKNQHALKLHIKQVHEKITRVTCQYCEKKMYNKYVLSKHIEKKHRQYS